MHIKTFLSTGLCLSLVALAVGCDDTNGSWPDNTADAVATYSQIVEASYEDSLTTATTLNDALTALVASPSKTALDTARTAWLNSREPYLQTEVYRFYDGPIDNPTDGPEGLLNAWPLDEKYIDYVADDATAGIINGGQTIDAATLESLNEQGGEANIATGYHAIEFLLWGQDSSPTEAGDRAFTDYVATSNGANGCYSGPPTHTCECGGTESACVEPMMWTDTCKCPINADRRGKYLTVVGDLLLTHLGQVHDAWVKDASYRTSFEADEQVAFEKILTGMIILSGFETGGERLQAALDSGDQEEEHSCFSDNTHRDMIQDVQGVMNVWVGSYTRTDGSKVEGTGVKDVVEAMDADLASRLDARIAESLSLANAMGTPFDQQIVPGSAGNADVQALVVSLQTQEQILFEVFDLFGLSVTIPE